MAGLWEGGSPLATLKRRKVNRFDMYERVGVATDRQRDDFATVNPDTVQGYLAREKMPSPLGPP